METKVLLNVNGVKWFIFQRRVPPHKKGFLKRGNMEPDDKIFLRELRVSCIIGIFPWERAKKQPVLIDLEFPGEIRKASFRDKIEDAVDYKIIAKATIRFVENSRFQLLESLAQKLADHLLERTNIPRLHLKISKPGAIRGSKLVGVEITRSRQTNENDWIYLGLGSNVNPGFHFLQAIEALSKYFYIKRTSHIYETSPVGNKKGQSPFWNMALALEKSTGLFKTRALFRRIEEKAGRLRSIDRYGDRTLDIDLLLWGQKTINTRGLLLPHKDLFSKAFVIFPLLEISPNLSVPGKNLSMVEIASRFSDPSQRIKRLYKMPLPN